ncbi:Phosphohistidine phosphatase SixA [Thalassocella blandensis]|nr:Phosphohistidine phosphatase SixA [Thalassocella blandensis]
MEIFIMRHGHAEPEAAQDSLRVLSASGRIEVQNAIETNLPSFAGLQKVIHSPYVRAQQTAEIALQSFHEVDVAQSDLLVPNGSVQNVVAYLHEVCHEQGVNSLMIVGHQPLFGSIVDELCGLEPGAHRLATASIAAIDTEVVAVGCCQLRWMRHVLHNSF